MGKIKSQSDAPLAGASSENSTNTRVMELIAAEGLSASAFADRIGVQRSSISHISNGRNEPSVPLIKKILQAFPNVNVEWLIMGIGDIYKGGHSPAPSLDVNNQNASQEAKEVSTVNSQAPNKPAPEPAAQAAIQETVAAEAPRRNTAYRDADVKECTRVDSVKPAGSFPGFMFEGGLLILNPNGKTYSIYRPE